MLPQDHLDDRGENRSISDLVSRLDERMKGVQAELKGLREALDKYVTQVEFSPIRLLVFGMAGLLLSSVIAAIIGTVLGHKL